jgi:hypothetical protein
MSSILGNLSLGNGTCPGVRGSSVERVHMYMTEQGQPYIVTCVQPQITTQVSDEPDSFCCGQIFLHVHISVAV